MKSFSPLQLLTLAVLFLSGCQYKLDKDKDPILSPPGENATAGEAIQIPGFAEINNQILAKNCAQCHSGSGINVTSHASTKRDAALILDSVIKNRMPRNGSPLTQAQKNLLKLWVENGAPEFAMTIEPTTPAPEPAPVPDEVVMPNLDWATISALVIEPSCVGCHSGPNATAGVDLETYTNTFRDIEDIEEAIRDGSMPFRSSLTPEQKKLVLDWIDMGAPEF